MTQTIYKTKKRQQIAFRRYLKGVGKGGEIAENIGCDLEYLKEWVESRMIEGMSWDNYGKEWVIDHIIPMRLFNLFSEEELNLVWHFKNLTPMFKCDNMNKEGDLRFSVLLLEQIHQCETVNKLKAIALREIEKMDNRYLKRQ